MASSHRLRLISLLAAAGLGVSGCAAPSPGTPAVAAAQTPAQPGSVAPAPTSQAAAETAVRRFFAISFPDDKSIEYRFAPFVRSSVSQPDIVEAGVFICGTLKPRDAAGDYTGKQVFFAHFNPLRRDVVDNASVQPGTETVTEALCRQAYAGSGVRLPG